jgi:hypothetical protein
VVYILDRKKIEDKNDAIRETAQKDELIYFIEPFSHDNHRLVSQAGLFTKSPYNYEIEDWIDFEFREQPIAYILRKILLPGVDRKDCLRALNRMNINYISLFPDIYGAAKHCNLSREIILYG